jgi:hypothetical protein
MSDKKEWREFWIDDITQMVCAPWDHPELGAHTLDWPDNESVIKVVESQALTELQAEFDSFKELHCKRLKELGEQITAKAVLQAELKTAKALIKDLAKHYHPETPLTGIYELIDRAKKLTTQDNEGE